MSEAATERIIFTGHVQGVGFRYTVRSIARRYPVKGYVKNLPDGSVELVVQGRPDAMTDLVADVARQFEGNIRHCERRPIQAAEAFIDFEIRF
jgi:acylphosphatase